MEDFVRLFGGLLALVYQCFDRIVILGHLPLLTRPENIVNAELICHFFAELICHFFSDARCPSFNDFASCLSPAAQWRRDLAPSGREAARFFAASGGARYLFWLLSIIGVPVTVSELWPAVLQQAPAPLAAACRDTC